MARGLLVGVALDINEHHRNPEATRQAVDLLMDDLLEVVIVSMVRRATDPGRSAAAACSCERRLMVADRS